MYRSSLKAIFVFIFMLTGLFGQNLSIQGVARDNTGQSLPDATYGFTFRLYLVETGGSNVWTEDQTLSVLNGVFSAVLGDVNSMAGLDFDQEYWLSLEIDNNGELSPRTKLILSPYAIMAEQTNQDNVFPLSGNVGIGVSVPLYSLDVRGGIRGDYNTTYDVWIQGGAETGGVERNLALLGNKDQDRLYLNYDGEYTNGTILGAKVGIGTNDPQEKLHVNGNIQIPSSGGIKNSSDDGNFILQTGWTSLFGDFTALNSGYQWGSSYEPVSIAAGTNGFYVTSATIAGTPFGKTLFRVNRNGDVNFGDNLEREAVSAEAQTHIIHGWVAADGTKENGAGFSCSRTGIGTYDITFDRQFSDNPTVTVTGVGGDAVDNMWALTWISPTYITIHSRDYVEDEASSPQNCRFMFIAIGNR